MEKIFTVSGMTCEGCASKVRGTLEAIPNITRAKVDLAAKEVTIEMQPPVELEAMKEALKKAGNYDIEKKEQEVETVAKMDIPEVSVTTYKPLILIVSFIVGVSVLAQYPFETFSLMLFMRHFMAGFFIVFAFFKILNLDGFASSYSMYDIVAAKWFNWGYVYPFLELGLGIAYLINVAPTYVNIATILLLGVSSIGVIKSNLDKKKIKCACLGDVFNLPMSTVTIIEDVSMVLMAAIMLMV